MPRKRLLILLATAICAAGLFLFFSVFRKEHSYQIYQPSGSLPSSYKISSVPYYSKKNFCYEASTMMILGYSGASEAEVNKFRDIVDKEGKGGPPDALVALKKRGLSAKARIAFSKAYNRSWESVYRNFLSDPSSQILLLNNQEDALFLLKKLVSSNIPVEALIDHGNHYVVVTGYDESHLYISDPDPDVGIKKESVGDFLEEWQNYKQDLGHGRGDLGFPGELGMIWLEK